MEIQPGEGRDGLGVVVQVGEVAFSGWDSHVEDQPLLRRLLVLGVQGSSGERGEDELVHLQYEGCHEAGLRRLVLHRTVDQNRQPHRLCLGAGQRDGKVKRKDKVAMSFQRAPLRSTWFFKPQQLLFPNLCKSASFLGRSCVF